MSEHDAARCPSCGEAHTIDRCEALRSAAQAGAQPPGVPLRVYGGYLEARGALRANVPAPAVRTLQWLLSHLAEERGAKPSLPLTAKVKALMQMGVISPHTHGALAESALSPDQSLQTAWALMSLVEHALSRLYLRKSA